MIDCRKKRMQVFLVITALLWFATGMVRSDPIRPEAESWETGNRLMQAGEIQEAQRVFEKLKRERLDDPVLCLSLGQVYLKQGFYQRSLDAYNQVLLQNEQHLEANIGRALALIGLDDARKALKHAQLATEIDPDHALAWEALGQAYIHPQLQDYFNAEQAFGNLVKLRPDDLKAAFLLAKALSFQKRAKEALMVLEKIFKKHPEEPELLLKLAEVHYVLRNLDRAETLVNRLLSHHPENQDGLRLREQITSRKAYNFWVPVVVLIALPIVVVLMRWMRKGRILKIQDIPKT